VKAQKGGWGVVEVYLYFFFNLGAGWLTPRLDRFIHWKEIVDCTEGWVGALVPGLEGWRKSRLYRDSIPGPSRP